MDVAWLPENNLWLCLCVCAHVTAFANFTHWFCVCACSTCVFSCVCFLQAAAMENRKLSLSLLPSPTICYLVRPLARPLACCSTQARRLCVSLFLSLSSCLLLSNSSPVEGQTVVHLLAKRKIVQHTHTKKEGRRTTREWKLHEKFNVMS